MKREVRRAENVSVDAEKITIIHAINGAQYFKNSHVLATRR